MRLPRALQRLSAATAPLSVSAPPDWRNDVTLTAMALRAGAREDELDAVLVALRGKAPVEPDAAASANVLAAVESVRAGGPTRFGLTSFGWGLFSPRPKT